MAVTAAWASTTRSDNGTGYAMIAAAAQTAERNAESRIAKSAAEPQMTPEDACPGRSCGRRAPWIPGPGTYVGRLTSLTWDLEKVGG